MRDRLNIFDPKIMKEIEAEYSSRKRMADKLARYETKELVNFIDYYRSTSFEEIEARVKLEANTKFINIDDNIALKRGLFQNIEKYYEKNGYDFSRLSREEKRKMIQKEVDSHLDTLSPEEKKTIIENYKKNNYDRYLDIQLNNARCLYNLFGYISVEEVKDYISLFYDLRVRENLLEARNAAIEHVAKEKNVETQIYAIEELEKLVDDTVEFIIDKLKI